MALDETNIKVLVVDDAALYRKILSDTLESVEGVEVVGRASNGRLALERLENLDVDLIFLDLFMPEMDGMETLLAIKEKHPNVSAVMISGSADRHADVTVRALARGALDFIFKPQEESFEKSKALLKEELERVIRTVRIANRSEKASNTHAKPSTNILDFTQVQPNKVESLSGVDLVLIGSSTGGPQALTELLPLLPADFECPILIVQHMPENFTAHLATSLERKSKINVVEACHGEELKAGRAYIAPGGQHMIVKKNASEGICGKLTIALTDGPPVNSCKPAVDVLFESVGNIDGLRILSIILTGMGRDGLDGVANLKTKQKRTMCIAQNKETCVVYGMPRQIIENNLADKVLPLNKIHEPLIELCNSRVLQNQ